MAPRAQEGPRQTESVLLRAPKGTRLTPPCHHHPQDPCCHGDDPTLPPSLPLSCQPHPPHGHCVLGIRRGGAELNTHSWSSRLVPWLLKPSGGRSSCPFAQSKAQEEGGRLWTLGEALPGGCTPGAQLLHQPPAPHLALACSQPPLVPEPPAPVIQPRLTSTWPRLPRWPPGAQGWGRQGGQSRPGLAE